MRRLGARHGPRVRCRRTDRAVLGEQRRERRVGLDRADERLRDDRDRLRGDHRAPRRRARDQLQGIGRHRARHADQLADQRRQLGGAVAPSMREPHLRQRVVQVLHAREAVGRIGRHRAQARGFEGRRDLGAQLARSPHLGQRRLVAAVLGHAARERVHAGQELVQAHAERELVALVGERGARGLLRRHVRPLALDRGADALAPRDAEVRDLHLAGGGEQQVRRADVGVDDRAGRTRVGVLEPGARALDEVGRQRQRQRPAAGGGVGAQELPQAGPVDELHHQEHVVALAHQVEHADHVGVRQRHQQLGLVDQAADELGVLGQGRQQALDRHRLLEPEAAQRAPGEHLGHAAAPQQLAEDIAAARGTAAVRHGVVARLGSVWGGSDHDCSRYKVATRGPLRGLLNRADRRGMDPGTAGPGVGARWPIWADRPRGDGRPQLLARKPL